MSLTKFPYDKQDFIHRFNYPSATHLLGTDNFGRDLWSRLLFGGRISLFVAVVSVSLSLTVGTILGSSAGYFGGWLDTVITRFLDIVMAIPGLLLAIAISAMLGSGPLSTRRWPSPYPACPGRRELSGPRS